MTNWRKDIRSRELVIQRGCEVIAGEEVDRLSRLATELEIGKTRDANTITELRRDLDEHCRGIEVAISALDILCEAPAKEGRTHAGVRQQLRQIRQALDAVCHKFPF